MSAEVSRGDLRAFIQTNASEVFGQRLSFQQNESQKHLVEETRELLRAERSISFTKLGVKSRQHHNRELQKSTTNY